MTALRRDPILVEQTMGSGDAAGTAKRLAAVAGKLPFPTYVALVSTPRDDDSSDASAYLATAISRQIGKPGLYVVETSAGVLATDMVGESYNDTLYDLQRHTNSAAVLKASGDKYVLDPAVDAETALVTATLPSPAEDPKSYNKANLSSAQIADLAAREKALAPAVTPDRGVEPAKPWTTGKRWMAGTTVGVGALLLIQQSVRGWPGWRRTKKGVELTKAVAAAAPGPEPDLQEIRRQAEEHVTALAEQLAAATRTVTDSDLLDAAGLARDAAEPLLDSTQLEEVVGALALARTGAADVARACGQRKTDYRGCFFNPLHGTSTTTASWRFGEADVDVPVCRACATALRAGSPPQSLRVGSRPYYERDDVWARTGFGSLVDDFASQVVASRSGR